MEKEPHSFEPQRQEILRMMDFEYPKGEQPFVWLSNEDLDKTYDVAQLAVKEAVEGLKAVEDERFRRYRIVKMLSMQGDWPGGDLKGMRRQANAPETY